MIYQMARDMTAGLVARSYPVDVHYYDMPLQAGAAGLRVTFGRDTRGGDRVGPVVGALRNPKGVWNRQLGVTIVLHVASGLPGAMRAEHEHLCDDLVDAVLTQLFAWCSESKASVPEILETSYVAPDEVEHVPVIFGMPAHPTPIEGVVYVIRVSISRGVTRRDYDGSALTEVGAGEYGVSDEGTVRVKVPGDDWEIVP